MDDAELRYLRALVERPGQPSSAYARAAGVNGQRAAKIRAKLVAQGLVREHRVALGVRGRTSIALEPLPAADAALARQPATPEDT